MSLASLLLGKAASATDSDLDAVFSRTRVERPVQSSSNSVTSAAAAAAAAAEASSSKNKIAPPQEIIKQAKIAKAKAASSSNRGSSKNAIESKGKGSNKKDINVSKNAVDTSDAVSYTPAKSKRKQIEHNPASTPDSTKKKRRRENNIGDDTQQSIDDDIPEPSENEEDDEDEEEEEDEDDQPLVHETLLLKNGKASTSSSSSSLQAKAKKAAKYAGETQSDRNGRTTFVGNVPVVCATSKSSKKALVRHLISTLPQEYQSVAKLDSIRFRSIQLSNPAFTSDGRDTTTTSSSSSHQAGNEEDDEEEEEKQDNHARKRSRRWKTGEIETSSSNGKKPLKFLTAAQKKKIGFIKGQIHEKASTCIAYIVWDTASPPPSTKGADSTTTTSKKPVTPQEIASLIIKHGNNTTFENFTLRLDHVKSKESQEEENDVEAKQSEAGDEKKKIQEGNKSKREIAIENKLKLEEEKRTLYIGSLDFEEKEESIRNLCENLMIEERGGKPINDGNNVGSDVGKSSSSNNSWVERVRLVRDPETGLGKGFAYVLFKDRECVDEMLALDSSRVKLSKRKLRLERCKTSSAKAAAANKAAKEAAQAARKEKAISDRKARGAFDSNKLPAVPIQTKLTPRPDIGEELKNLSKEERKSLKSADDERLRRRLEKKNLKRQSIKTEKQKEFLDKRIKSAGGGSYKAKIDPAKEGMKKSKRMRSDKAVFAKNRKKAI